MPEACIRLDEIHSHSCPLGTLTAENHCNSRSDRWSLIYTGYFKLSVVPNGKCSLNKPFSVDSQSIPNVGNGVQVVINVGLVDLKLLAEGCLGVR